MNLDRMAFYKKKLCDPKHHGWDLKMVCCCHRYASTDATDEELWEWEKEDRDSLTTIIDGVEFLHCGHESMHGGGCECIIAERKVS